MRLGSLLLSILAVGANFGSAATALAQQDPPQWNVSASYLGGGLVRGSNGDFYRCLKSNTGHDPTKDARIYWELYYVRTNLNLSVAKSGATFPSFQQAWAMLQGATIAAGATVTIYINSNGGIYTESFTSALSLNHPFGRQIFIQGDAMPNVIFNFHLNENAFLIDHGHGFGGVNNITMDGAGPSYNGLRAFFIQDGSSLGPSNLTMQGFYYGLDCRNHSTANIVGSVITGIQTAGIFVADNSNVNAQSVTFGGLSGKTQFGVQVSNGSTVDAASSNANYCGNAYYATNNSTIDASMSAATANAVGYWANLRSTINADASQATNNSTAYNAVLGSYISAHGISLTGNANTYNISPNLTSSDQSFIHT